MLHRQLVTTEIVPKLQLLDQYREWGLHYDAGVDFFAFYLFLAQTHISHQSLSFQIDTWTRLRARRVVFPLTRDLTKLLTGKQPRRRWLLIIRPCHGPAN